MNGMLAPAIAFETFQAVRGRSTKIGQDMGAVEHIEFSQGGAAITAMGFPPNRAEPELLARGIPEVQDHPCRTVIRRTYNAAAAILFQRRRWDSSS